MPSRVTIFDHYGLAIAEVNTTTTRSWVLDDIGRCMFPLATFTDANCNRQTLQYGNFVLVEHIPTRDGLGGTNGTLPPWIGIIMPPQQWEYGRLMVTAYSAESLLSYRPMPYITAKGSAGSVFQQMIGFANGIGGFPLEYGEIYPYSSNTNYPLRLSMYEEAKNLARAFQQDWDVTYTKTLQNQLVLYANWYQQKGVTVNAAFTEGIGGNMKLPRLTEQGILANLVFGYNVASSDGKRLTSSAIYDPSVGDYGVLGTNANFSVNGQAAVDIATQNVIYTQSRATITLELTALDAGDTFTYLSVGNVWDVALNSVGFYGGNIGFQGSVRLTAVEYSDYDNEARLTTQVLKTDLTRANYA